MKAYISTSPIGVFAFDENGKLLQHVFFKKDPELVAKKLERSADEVIEEERGIIKKLKARGVSLILWRKEKGCDGVRCEYDSMGKGDKFMRSSMRRVALSSSLFKNDAELNEFISSVGIAMAKIKVAGVGKDRIITHVVGAIDDLDKMINTMSERLREWYSVHFPEANKAIKSHKRFAELVCKYGRRENFKERELKRMAESSMGVELSKGDVEAVMIFSNSLLELYRTREILSNYLSRITNEVMPNVTAIAGPMLAGKLLSMAGSLEKLARFPSSTIQLLGAEKALFRHLRGGGKAPKYGVIFSHPFIQQAPKELRGKVARLIAAKISIAAKMDAFSGKDRGRELIEELKRRLGEIKRK